MFQPAAFLAAVLLASFAAPVVHANCAAHRDLEAVEPLDGISAIEVLATSGELRISGRAGAGAVEARGRACTDRRFRDRVDEIAIRFERRGSVLVVIADVPFRSARDEWRIGSLDLELAVPDALPLTVTDSSGDLRIRGVRTLELTDSSGDVELADIAESLVIHRDSSGSMRIRDAGEVVIHIDSSGDIDIAGAASVFIGTDTSGDIEVRDVRGDVSVGSDSSGSIYVRNVGGRFSVSEDSSGTIHANEVRGGVFVPER